MEIAAIETMSREELIAAFFIALQKKDQKISSLQFQLSELQRVVFGSKSERSTTNPDHSQGVLFELESEEKNIEAAPEKEEITYERNKSTGNKKPSRQLVPSHIPQVEIIVPRPNGTEGWKVIGLDKSSVLDYQPASIFATVYVTERLVNPADEDAGVKTAKLPARIIPKGKVGAGLIAYIIVSKFVDHIPLYRLIGMFRRQGAELNDSTMNDWMRESYKAFLPLYERMRKYFLTLGYLQCDETPIKVLEKMITEIKKNEEALRKAHQGYFWVYYSPVTKLAFFDYRKGRDKSGPTEFLKDFSGNLQADGYSVYEPFDKRPNIILHGCMTHSRRKFEHAKSNDKKRSAYAMAVFRQLYAIEAIAREKNLSSEERQKLREESGAGTILKNFLDWCIEEHRKVRPESAIGKAISYFIGRYKYLIRYVNNGEIEIDNNLVENSIRPVAIGRKNYMFAGSHGGADWAALFYTFTACCKSLGIDPFQYLRDVATRLPNTPEENLDDLLPHKWKQQVFDIPQSAFIYPEVTADAE